MLRLHVLRYLFIVVFFFAAIITRKERFVWLLHYLVGSGRNRQMPVALVDISMIARGRRNHRTYIQTKKGYKYHLNHSLEYEGKGFYGRPEAFYVVGGMTYSIEFKGNQVFVSGTDVYDWHPDSNGNFFTSALWLPATRLMGSLFGREYFPVEGFPTGTPGISNKLWMDLGSVGARDFTTFIDVVKSSNEWRKAARRHR